MTVAFISAFVLFVADFVYSVKTFANVRTSGHFTFAKQIFHRKAI